MMFMHQVALFKRKFRTSSITIHDFLNVIREEPVRNVAKRRGTLIFLTDIIKSFGADATR